MDYELMLKKAKEELPEETVERTRFEIPKIKGYIEGNKTIISNFMQISDFLHREPSLVLKFLQKELATPAIIEGGRLILGRKINSKAIDEKIDQFVKNFVICKECKKPDTKLFKEGRILLLKCMACGAKHPIRV